MAGLDVRGGIIDVSGGESGVVRFRALREADRTSSRSPISTRHRRRPSWSAGGCCELSSPRARSTRNGPVPSPKPTPLPQMRRHRRHDPPRRFSRGRHRNHQRRRSDLGVGSRSRQRVRQRRCAPELTLRAAGDLTINGNISDGFSNASATGTLQDASSWDLRLVAGADLTSANALAVKPLAGLARRGHDYAWKPIPPARSSAPVRATSPSWLDATCASPTSPRPSIPPARGTPRSIRTSRPRSTPFTPPVVAI